MKDLDKKYGNSVDEPNVYRKYKQSRAVKEFILLILLILVLGVISIKARDLCEATLQAIADTL